MNVTPPAARVAFVIHLEGPHSKQADVARIQHIIHLFHGHHLRATWSIANCDSLARMYQKGLLDEGDEVALALQPLEISSVAFRGSLRSRLASIQFCTGRPIGLLAGDPDLLRPHGAFLNEQQLRGILSCSARRAGSPTHSPLPCGLWRLDHALAIPHTSLFNRLFFGGSPLHQLNKLIAGDDAVLISVDALKVAHGSTRHLQCLEKFLRHVSHCISRNEISLTTPGEIVAELSAHRVSRPQHSILKPLAA